jgi:hypothetical protein
LHVALVAGVEASLRRWVEVFRWVDFVAAAEAAAGMPADKTPAAAAPMSTMRFKLSPE